MGGSKTLRDGDDVAIVAAGITLHEALRAADALAEEGISARVIDCYSVKPIDGDALAGLGMPIVTVEDHRAEGGLGEAVLSALAERGASPPGHGARGARAPAVRARPPRSSRRRGSIAEHIAEAARAAARAAVAGLSLSRRSPRRAAGSRRAAVRGRRPSAARG